MQTSNCLPGDKRPQSTLGQSGEPCWDDQRAQIFTIGHSSHELVRFIELLGLAEIAVLADVRSSPFSQRLPQFNQPELQHAVENSGMRYVFLGDELGGRPRDIAVYDGEGRVDYWRVRQTALFRAGVKRLLDEFKHDAVALVCAEEDPLDCHRALMIAPHLVEQGICPRHIRGDARIETTAQLEARLFQITGVGGGMATGLFAASLSADERAELLTDAYKEQAHRKAFRLPPGQDINEIDTLSEFSAE